MSTDPGHWKGLRARGEANDTEHRKVSSNPRATPADVMEAGESARVRVRHRAMARGYEFLKVPTILTVFHPIRKQL